MLAWAISPAESSAGKMEKSVSRAMSSTWKFRPWKFVRESDECCRHRDESMLSIPCRLASAIRRPPPDWWPVTAMGTCERVDGGLALLAAPSDIDHDTIIGNQHTRSPDLIQTAQHARVHVRDHD